MWENTYFRIENPNASTGLNNHLGLWKRTTERTKSFIAPSFASTSDSSSGSHYKPLRTCFMSMLTITVYVFIISGGSKRSARDVRPPGSKFFYFHAVFGKKIEK